MALSIRASSYRFWISSIGWWIWKKLECTWNRLKQCQCWQCSARSRVYIITWLLFRFSSKRFIFSLDLNKLGLNLLMNDTKQQMKRFLPTMNCPIYDHGKYEQEKKWLRNIFNFFTTDCVMLNFDFHSNAINHIQLLLKNAKEKSVIYVKILSLPKNVRELDHSHQYQGN